MEYHRTNGISKNREYKKVDKLGIIVKMTDYTQAYGLLHIMHITAASWIEEITGKVIQAGFLLMPDTES